jgi:hypothetical protein
VVARRLEEERRFGRDRRFNKRFSCPLARKLQIFGARHHEVAATQNNLAALLFGRGYADEALALSSAALSVIRERLGEAHPLRVGCEALARDMSDRRRA